MKHVITSLTLVLLVLLPAGVRAQTEDNPVDPDFDIVLRPLSLQPRSGAPMWLELSIDNRKQELLPGSLELTVAGTGQVRTSWESLPISPGSQRMRLLAPTPAPEELIGTAQFTVKIRHGDPGNMRDLGAYGVAATPSARRAMVIALVDAFTGMRPVLTELALALRPEQFDPVEGSQQRVPALGTAPARMMPEEVPYAAIGFTAFDVVAVTGDGLAGLGPRQLAALDTWVRAGGAAYVLLDRPVATLPGEATALLDGWLGRPIAVTLNEMAGLAVPRHLDWGRVVVDVQPEGLRATSKDSRWRTIAPFLWRFTMAPREAVLASGVWQPSGEDDRSQQQRQGAQQVIANQSLTALRATSRA